MAKTRRRPAVLLIFVTLIFVGIALLAVAEWQNEIKERNHVAVEEARKRNQAVKHEYDWRTVGVPLMQHLASALIVAAVMGVTYEYFVHQHVVEDFEELLAEHERATEFALDSMRTTTAHDVLTLIGDIAVNTKRIPTLFSPARDDVNEIVFSKDKKFFERLLGTPNARAEGIALLRKWLRSSKLNLRFLASDFVGLLFLTELEQEVRDLALEQQKQWRNLTADERSVVLNYWWAASRCQPKRYELLRDRLVNWQDEFVQQWILFVPRQMPDLGLAKLVQLFLRVRGGEATKEVLRSAIEAIEMLHHSVIDMRRTVTVNRASFERVGLWTEACAAVSAVPAGAPTSSRLVRGLRRAGDFFKRWKRRRPRK